MVPSGAFVFRCSQAPFLAFVVEEGVAVVGRDPSCDIVLDAPTVSRRHAELRVEEAGLFVRDLGSRNGTFIDKSRIQTRQVFSRQVVQFGDVELIVSSADRESLQQLSKERTDDPRHVAARAEFGLHAGPERLSNAQHRVFKLLLDGLAEKSISKRLDLSRHTVHHHTQAIFRVFGVHSRSELLARFVETTKSATPGAS